MRYATNPGMGLLTKLVIGASVSVVVAVGGLATLWLLGVVELPFLKKTAEPSHEGMIPMPTSGDNIPMYTKVTPENLYEPKTTSLKVTWFKPEEVRPNHLTRLEQVLGRVLKRDKPAGKVFTEEDFFPKGTHEGMVAGIPPGKVALTLEVEKIKGVAGFRAGDHLDVVGALALDDKKSSGASGLVTPVGFGLPAPKHASVKVLVQNGVIVSPVTLRQVPVTTNSLMSGQQTKTRPVQELVIAVDRTEVAGLSEALALNAEVTAVARSGRPDDPGAASLTPDLPPPKFDVVETMVGAKRRFMVFTDGGAASIPAGPPSADKKADDKPAAAGPPADAPLSP
jgi:Flp pilus assembly protein CpaB